MKFFKMICAILSVFMVMSVSGCGQQKVQRVGMVIGIKPEMVEEYKKLHADTNSGVRDLLKKANITNFSIYIQQFDDGKYYLFGYYEYTGNDYDADMKKLSDNPRNTEWLKLCDPMQIPFQGQNSWQLMKRVYYNKS